MEGLVGAFLDRMAGGAGCFGTKLTELTEFIEMELVKFGYSGHWSLDFLFLAKSLNHKIHEFSRKTGLSGKDRAVRAGLAVVLQIHAQAGGAE
jgi:hypothetical protein